MRWTAGDAAAVFVTALTQDVVSSKLHAHRRLEGSAVVSFLQAVAAPVNQSVHLASHLTAVL